MERGDCTFVTKVRNVEKAGGSLAVIIDNTDENVHNIVMSDDGTGSGIKIPSMLIDRKTGKMLTNFLTQNSEELTSKAALSAEFIIEMQDHVEWQLWYTSINDKSLDFIKNFNEYQQKFDRDQIRFQPHIVTWACPYCSTDYKEKECLSDGRYCSMNHKGHYIKGSDIILEDLREICLYKNLHAKAKEQKWWEYMQYVHKMCYEEITEECSKMAHKHLGLDYKETMDCVDGSFEG